MDIPLPILSAVNRDQVLSLLEACLDDCGLDDVQANRLFSAQRSMMDDLSNVLLQHGGQPAPRIGACLLQVTSLYPHDPGECMAAADVCAVTAETRLTEDTERRIYWVSPLSREMSPIENMVEPPSSGVEYVLIYNVSEWDVAGLKMVVEQHGYGNTSLAELLTLAKQQPRGSLKKASCCIVAFGTAITDTNSGSSSYPLIGEGREDVLTLNWCSNHWSGVGGAMAVLCRKPGSAGL